MVTVPGKPMRDVPIAPAEMAAPLDFINTLMSLVDVAALTVTEPKLTAEPLVPDVVSNTILATAPFVLAVAAMAPVWVILLFEVSVRLEPLDNVTAPTSTPSVAPAAVSLPVTLMLAPAPVTFKISTVLTVAAVVPVALMVIPDPACKVVPVAALTAMPVVDTPFSEIAPAAVMDALMAKPAVLALAADTPPLLELSMLTEPLRLIAPPLVIVPPADNT